MEYIDPLSQMQKKMDLFDVRFWRKKSGKTVKRVNFFVDPFDGQVNFFHNVPSKLVLFFFAL